MTLRKPILGARIALLLLAAACQSDGSGAPQAESGAAGPGAETAAGKPSAPITIRYKVLGTAIVGQPVPIEVELSSSVSDRPITLSYSINDSASMLFPESQARRVDVRMAADGARASRQVTVVPQREGRLYLNVLAEIDTDAGRMIKTMAIPISVGPGAAPPPEHNGELQEDADGEAVESMPAEES